MEELRKGLLEGRLAEEEPLGGPISRSPPKHLWVVRAAKHWKSPSTGSNPAQVEDPLITGGDGSERPNPPRLLNFQLQDLCFGGRAIEGRLWRTLHTACALLSLGQASALGRAKRKTCRYPYSASRL